MGVLEEYLQVSAQLFKHLTNIPADEERTDFIEQINELLDKRGELVNKVVANGFQYNPEEKSHQTLYELDKGIRERLELVMNAIKHDIKDFQNSKKYERQYIDPYENVRVVEGRYFDNKK